MGRRGHHLGHLQRPGRPAGCSGGRPRPGRSRTGLRHRVLLGLAREPRGTARPAWTSPQPSFATARRCQELLRVPFPLLEADAAHVPLPSPRFDLAISDAAPVCGATPPAGSRSGPAPLPGPDWSSTPPAPSAGHVPARPRPEGPAPEHCSVRSATSPACNPRSGGVEFHPSHSDWITILRSRRLRHRRTPRVCYAPPGATTTPTTGSPPPNGLGDGPSRIYGSPSLAT